MFFWKETCSDVPKALSFKKIKANPDTSFFWETSILLYLQRIFFLSLYAFRLPRFPLVDSGYAGLGQ